MDITKKYDNVAMEKYRERLKKLSEGKKAGSIPFIGFKQTKRKKRVVDYGRRKTESSKNNGTNIYMISFLVLLASIIFYTYFYNNEKSSLIDTHDDVPETETTFDSDIVNDIQSGQEEDSKKSSGKLSKAEKKKIREKRLKKTMSQMGPYDLHENCSFREEDGSCVDLRPWRKYRNGKEYIPPAGCVDKHDACANFKSTGNCDSNPGWMIVFCPLTCKACELLDVKRRCGRYPEQSPVLQANSIAETFLRLETKFSHLEPDLKLRGENGLYFAVFKNFLSNHEADTLVNWLERLNPKR
eukprot:UN28484